MFFIDIGHKILKQSTYYKRYSFNYYQNINEVVCLQQHQSSGYSILTLTSTNKIMRPSKIF